MIERLRLGHVNREGPADDKSYSTHCPLVGLLRLVIDSDIVCHAFGNQSRPGDVLALYDRDMSGILALPKSAGAESIQKSGNPSHDDRCVRSSAGDVHIA